MPYAIESHHEYLVFGCYVISGGMRRVQLQQLLCSGTSVKPTSSLGIHIRGWVDKEKNPRRSSGRKASCIDLRTVMYLACISNRIGLY